VSWWGSPRGLAWPGFPEQLCPQGVWWCRAAVPVPAGDGGIRAPQLLVGVGGAAGGPGHAPGAGALPVPAGPGRAASGVAVGAGTPAPRLLPRHSAAPAACARLQPPDARADPELPAAGGGGQRPWGGMAGGASLRAGSAWGGAPQGVTSRGGGGGTRGRVTPRG